MYPLLYNVLVRIIIYYYCNVVISIPINMIYAEKRLFPFKDTHHKIRDK